MFQLMKKEIEYLQIVIGHDEPWEELIKIGGEDYAKDVWRDRIKARVRLEEIKNDRKIE